MMSRKHVLHYNKNVGLWIHNYCNAVQEVCSKYSLWINGLYTLLWVQEDFKGPISNLWHARYRHEASSYIALLKLCGKHKDLCRGAHIHQVIMQKGLISLCSDALIIMYIKCGELTEAKTLFEASPKKSIFMWTALISGFTQMDCGENALLYFDRMQDEGLSPDAVTFTCALKACGSIKAMEKGKQIHDQISKKGLLSSNIKLGNTLINMYAKCGALAKAHELLEELPNRNTVSWNAIIAGYRDQGKDEQALSAYEGMQSEGILPDVVTFICLLKACGSIGAIDKGKEIHEKINKLGFLETDLVLGNTLVDMYAKCNDMQRAQEVSDGLPIRDAISWNTLILGYAQQGEGENSLKCYDQMQKEGVSPTEVTFICVLKACANIGALERGIQIHDQTVERGLLQNNLVLGATVVDMYAKCGAVTKAEQVLKNLPVRSVIAWSALIAGYARHGQGERAISSFEEMLCEGFSPDIVTFISVLKACGSIQATDMGVLIHEKISEQGLLEKDIVLGTALLHMYLKCGSLTKARQVFEELCSRDAISWSALITGYAEYGENEQVFKCFEQMKREEVSPDSVTFMGVLKACSSMGAMEMGEKLHHEITKQGLLACDEILGTALLNMYAKCGALAKAHQVFEQLPVRNLVTWSALIAGHVEKGESEQALDCFKQMQQEGPCPDEAIFLAILGAYSRSGRVEDAQIFLGNMSLTYGVKPDSKLYGCLVDLFGRIGKLDKAVAMIRKIPDFWGGAWPAILCACEKLGDVNVGRWAFNHGMQMDKRDATYYVLMANIYAAAGLQKEAREIETVELENEAWRSSKKEKVISMTS
ncbi:hypothetical protein KP509_10G077700 [Ceratopteris richardii]|uniref:Pentatricopeptide repeat-containing protein n=1 Tax=Ceratopteris richardii TaxID=49495 RepID=A0A8T2TYX0_CERRI|nr:hypothetical protein KP509_10G077700 [Ceratopteris richardii]